MPTASKPREYVVRIPAGFPLFVRAHTKGEARAAAKRLLAVQYPTTCWRRLPVGTSVEVV